MPQPGHVDVNVMVIYSGLIQVNARTRRPIQATCQSDALRLVSFFSSFFWDRAGLCSQSSPSIYLAAVRPQLPLFPGRTNKHPPKYTNQKDSLPICTEEKPKIFLLLFPLCCAGGFFLSWITISHPCSHQTVFRQFAPRRCTASASVSDGCQHDHGTRHQMADLGSVSWVSERHLLAVWRWV